eukprot:COSAG01_NODE_13819_length_1530_cov_3.316562_2_plen_100_part_00
MTTLAPPSQMSGCMLGRKQIVSSRDDDATVDGSIASLEIEWMPHLIVSPFRTASLSLTRLPAVATPSASCSYTSRKRSERYHRYTLLLDGTHARSARYQ